LGTTISIKYNFIRVSTTKEIQEWQRNKFDKRINSKQKDKITKFITENV
jgi:hypothetical protein